MTIRLLHLAVTIFVSQTFRSHTLAYCFEIMHFFKRMEPANALNLYS